MEVITAVRDTLAAEYQLPFMQDIKTAVLSVNPSLDHFQDYGITVDQLNGEGGALPWRTPVPATNAALTVPQVCRHIACFIEESNEILPPLPGNLKGTSHKDLILADIDAWIVANGG